MFCDFCGKRWVTPPDIQQPAFPHACDDCKKDGVITEYLDELNAILGPKSKRTATELELTRNKAKR